MKVSSIGRILLIVVLAVYFGFITLFIGNQLVDSVREKSDPNLAPDQVAAVALDTSDRILNLFEVILSIVGILLPLMVAVFIYLYQQVFEAQATTGERAEKAQSAAENAAKEAEKLNAEVRQTLKEVGATQAIAHKLQGDVENSLERQLETEFQVKKLLREMQDTQNTTQDQYGLIRVAESNVEHLDMQVQRTLDEIHDSRRDLEKIRDRIGRVQERLLRFDALAAVQNSGVSLLSEDRMQALIAAQTLNEYSHADDPVVRFEYVHALDNIAGLDDSQLPTNGIVARLQEMSESDPEPAIRLAARRVLDKFNRESSNGQKPSTSPDDK